MGVKPYTKIREPPTDNRFWHILIRLYNGFSKPLLHYACCPNILFVVDTK